MEAIGLDCDIWIPAARPDVFTAANAVDVRAALVLQGANIPATREAGAEFHRRGILSIPDFVANAGGVICAAVEYAGGTAGRAFAVIEEKVRATTVWYSSGRDGMLPREAAERLAAERVEEAMRYRRRSSYS
jgi:glutamate dehydrogenase (NAD(P)+)